MGSHTALMTCIRIPFYAGEIENVHVVRNRSSNAPAFAFVEFVDTATAEHVLHSATDADGKSVLPFKLNWASLDLHHNRRSGDGASKSSVYVGDLPQEVTDAALLEPFKQRYESAASAKVVTDSHTGRSKGYGFVRFTDSKEQQKALEEMQGLQIAGQSVRVSIATPRRSNASHQDHPQQYLRRNFRAQQYPQMPYQAQDQPFPDNFPFTPVQMPFLQPQNLALQPQPQPQPIPAAAPSPAPAPAIPPPATTTAAASAPGSPPAVSTPAAPTRTGIAGSTNCFAPGIPDHTSDPTNSTIFVGGVEGNVTEEQLHELFQPYGEVQYVRVLQEKGCGFVRFERRDCAERALHELSGIRLGNTQLRLSWGKSGSMYHRRAMREQKHRQQQQQQQKQQQLLVQQQQQQQQAPLTSMLMPYYIDPTAAAPSSAGYVPHNAAMAQMGQQQPVYFMPMPAAGMAAPAPMSPASPPVESPMQLYNNQQRKQQQHQRLGVLASAHHQPQHQQFRASLMDMESEAGNMQGRQVNDRAPGYAASASDAESSATSTSESPSKRSTGFFGEIPAAEDAQGAQESE